MMILFTCIATPYQPTTAEVNVKVHPVKFPYLAADVLVQISEHSLTPYGLFTKNVFRFISKMFIFYSIRDVRFW